MPVYLFTYHAYGSWMPDNPRGFAQDGEGYQPPNLELADAYRDAAKYDFVEFDGQTERLLIEVAGAAIGAFTAARQSHRTCTFL